MDRPTKQMTEPESLPAVGSVKEANRDDRGPGCVYSNTEPLVYTIAQAAELLQIGRSLIYSLANTGGLPVIRIGKRILIPRRALLDRLAMAQEGRNDHAER